MPTLEEIHEFAVEAGIAEDPRDEDQIDTLLDEREEQYEQLEGVRKEGFDENRLENPFDDSRLVYGGDQEMATVAVGIDIEMPELLLVDRLNRAQDRGIDGVIAHHPTGRSLARLHGVMALQIDTLHNAGMPVSQAESVVRSRARDVRQGVHGVNHARVPQAAELLDLPMTTMHTITDNHAHQFVKDYLDDEEPRTLDDLIDALLEIEEYQWALEYDMGPEIFVGNADSRVGNLAFDFTGGTELDADRLESMANAGIDTIVAMHMSKDQIDESKDQHLNVVCAGHMASDSLGMNLLLDKLQDEYELDVVELSGFTRVER